MSVSRHVVNRVKHLPMVGIVVTISPSLSLYKIVVFPAASSPTIKMRISFLPNRPDTVKVTA